MRLKQIDVLRGIAALLVTIFHLTGSAGLSKTTAAYGAYGWVGVPFFFVISGFILPFSMNKIGYQLKNFGTFMCKRMARIYPAYFVALLISISLAMITNRQFLPMTSTLADLLFLTDLFGLPSWSPVFWTLAIEIQFYFLLGLCYPILIKSNLSSTAFVLIISLLSYWAPTSTLIRWFPFFALGILIFNKGFMKMKTEIFWLCITLLVGIISVTHSVIHATAGLFAVLFILFFSSEKEIVVNKLLFILGTISYSLYLVHWELGRASVAVSKRIPLFLNNEWIGVIIGLISSLIFAYLLYLFIERPSLRLSTKIKYARADK